MSTLKKIDFKRLARQIRVKRQKGSLRPIDDHALVAPYVEVATQRRGPFRRSLTAEHLASIQKAIAKMGNLEK